MRYITRTIKTVIAVVKVYNTETDNIEEMTLSLGNVPENKVESEVNRQLKKTEYKFIKVIGTTNDEAKYKMSEADFIANAEVVE